MVSAVPKQTLPWTRDQAGLQKMIVAWQKAKDADDFMRKNDLNKKQFQYSRSVMKTAMAHIPTLKNHKLKYSTKYDWDLLKKIAAEAAS